MEIIKNCTIQNRLVQIDGKEIFCQEQGTFKEFLSALYRHIDIEYPKFFKMDILSKAGFLASELLLDGIEDIADQNTAIYLANSSASLDTDWNYQQTIGSEYFPSPSVFVYTLPNIVAGEISIRHKLYGENLFFVMPEFNRQQIFDYISFAAKITKISYAIVGWLECREENHKVEFLLIENKN